MYYFEVLKALYEKKIKYLVVGGLAVNLYGVPRVTQDVDVIISTDKSNILKVVEALTDLGYVSRLPLNPKDLADKEKLDSWIKNKNLKSFSFYNKDQNYKVVDILLVHPLNFEKSFENKVVRKMGKIKIYLASIDDLIKTKEFSGRNQDYSDINMLKTVKRYIDGKNG